MKVAFVTGSNKGIGRAIVEKLAQTLGPSGEWDIYLTARNEELGKKTLSELEKKGLSVKFHQLDINDALSRKKFIEFLTSHYPNGINIAINNAGIIFKSNSTASFGEQARVTLKTNFFDTLSFTEEFMPHLAKDARVVAVSSMASIMAMKDMGDALYNKFISPMTMDELLSLAHDYIKHAEAGDYKDLGWPAFAYGVSKVCLTKAYFILGDKLENDPRNIIINSCCPGYVATDLNDHKGRKTVEEGADTPCYLATLPVGVKEPINEFVFERKICEWRKTTPVIL